MIRVKETVTITRGPLKGETGFIKRMAGPNRFVVALDFLAARATVELSATSLKKNGVKRPRARRQTAGL